MNYFWLLVPWTIAGVASFAYWFTLDHDLKLEDLFAMAVVGFFFGPFAFPMGWCIHTRKSLLDLTLIKSRNRHE